MKQDYFIYNGKRYPAGTVVIMRLFSIHTRCLYNEKATFLCYDTATNEYILEILGQNHIYSQESFNRSITGIYNPNKSITSNVKIQPKQHTFSDELNIDGLLIAWIWYVFIMAVAVIFYDRIGIWIVASIMFFSYRNRKLKEAGYK